MVWELNFASLFPNRLACPLPSPYLCPHSSSCISSLVSARAHPAPWFTTSDAHLVNRDGRHCPRSFLPLPHNPFLPVLPFPRNFASPRFANYDPKRPQRCFQRSPLFRRTKRNRRPGFFRFSFWQTWSLLFNNSLNKRRLDMDSM